MHQKSDNKFGEDYFLRGPQTGLSNYHDYRWLPELTIPMAQALKQFLRIKKGEKLLDYGCARGYLVKALRGLKIDAHGYDISEWAIANCDPAIKRFVGHAFETTPKYYDYVFSKDVLEHISTEELHELLPKLFRSTYRTALFIVPLAERDGGPYIYPNDEKDATHIQRRTLAGWMEFLQKYANDFVVMGATYVPVLKLSVMHYPGVRWLYTLREIFRMKTRRVSTHSPRRKKLIRRKVVMPIPSIAMVCNVYQDAPALRGLLETSARFFDNIYIVHAGPGGAYSTDGTIELCKQFGATIVFDDINKGFGHIRSRLVHDCGCEWAFIMDADERFYPNIPKLTCSGDDTWGVHKSLDVKMELTVSQVNEDVLDQGRLLKQLISNPDMMAVRSTRRHWFDFTLRRPSQNWLLNRDFQLRIVRNVPEIGYKMNVRMHEQILDSRTNDTPVFAHDDPLHGIFHDHFHLWFRKAQPGHKEFNEQNYQRLDRGETMLVKE